MTTHAIGACDACDRVRAIQARIRAIHAAIKPDAAGTRELQRERYLLRRELHSLDPRADLIARADWEDENR